MIVRLHYSKQGASRGLPWTLHTSAKCYQLEKVHLMAPAVTESKPHLSHNPRYFVKVEDAELEIKGKIAWVWQAPWPGKRKRS